MVLSKILYTSVVSLVLCRIQTDDKLGIMHHKRGKCSFETPRSFSESESDDLKSESNIESTVGQIKKEKKTPHAF